MTRTQISFLIFVSLTFCGCDRSPTNKKPPAADTSTTSALQTQEPQSASEPLSSSEPLATSQSEPPQRILPPRPEDLPEIAEDVVVQLREMKTKTRRYPNGHYQVEARNNPLFTNDSIDLVLKCPNIEDLTLERVMVTDEGLKKIKDLKLNRLILNGSPITAGGLAMLSNQGMVNSMISLGLKDTPFSDEHLAIILKFKHLQRLDLGETSITDASIASLQQLPLIRLDVTNSKITPEGLQLLQAKMPTTQVITKK